MGNFYDEGVRCKPFCNYPMITDEVNEVCVCDEANFYFFNPFLLTGDIYRYTNDN